MRIRKYNQSCMLIETSNKRILIDPGVFGYNEELLINDWVNIDIILITHKHSDHCNKKAIEKIVDKYNAKLIITREVQSEYQFGNYTLVKEADVLQIDSIKIEVIHAQHGYLTGMRERNAEVVENVGYIIDDGNLRFYTTSDTINFYNNIKCDVIAMPFNGNGLTMGVVDAVDFVKQINPKMVLPVHMEHPNPIMNPDLSILNKVLKDNSINYKILELKDTVIL